MRFEAVKTAEKSHPKRNTRLKSGAAEKAIISMNYFSLIQHPKDIPAPIWSL